MLEEERERSKEMLQMQQRRTYCKGLWRKIVNEEMKDSRRIRWRRQWEKRQKTGFWRKSWVGMVQEISPVNSQNKYVIPN